MRFLPLLCALLAASPALAGKPERLVVVSTGRLIVLEDRRDLRRHLDEAIRRVNEAWRKTRPGVLQDLLGNARNRLDNAHEFLGFAPPEEGPQAVTKEGFEDDDRMADAVLSRNLIVVDLETLWWELGRADLNLSRAEAQGPGPDFASPIDRARSEIGLARETLARIVGKAPAAAPEIPPPHNSTRPMTIPPHAPRIPEEPPPAATFDALLSAMDQEAFAEARLRVLATAAPSQLFLVAHVQQILERFPFSKHKLEAARILRDRISDRQNVYLLYASFPFEGDKKAFQRLMSGAELEAAQPIANTALDALVQQIRRGNSQVGFQRLRDECTRSYFRVDQVSVLLGLFPTFDGRFHALQIVRPRIVDPENWERLEPFFASQQDRARLHALFGGRH